MKIGLLEDEQSQITLIRQWVDELGYTLQPFKTGAEFRQHVADDSFDLFILDWNLPDTTGIDILDWLRSTLDWQVPVLFITSRDSEQDIVKALDHGSDDYIIKPVNKDITLARIKALIRRSRADVDADFINFEPYNINLRERIISLNDEPVKLTNKEFELALMLFRHSGRLISRAYIMQEVWGTKADLKTRTVDTHISRIRSKLGLSPDRGWQLSSVYHHGYRLSKIDLTVT